MRDRKRRNFNQGYRGGLFFGKATGAIVMIALMGALGLMIVLQINDQSAKGYALSDLESRKAKLLAEKERLQIEAVRLQSIQEIQKENSTSDKKFVPVQKINYLPSTNVAVK